MGLSLVVGTIAAGAATAGYALRNTLPTPVIYALGHAAIAGFIVSAAASSRLCHSTTWLLGKDRRTGRFRPALALLMWPFHLGLHLRINARRARSTEPLYHRVADGWYVGGWPASPSALPSANVGVVDCTCEFSRTHSAPYLCLPTWDTRGVHATDIAAAVEFSLAQRAAGRDVYVHCAHGHGRSVAVLCACLVMAGAATTYTEALASARAVRPKAKLNAPQRSQLEAYLVSVKKLP